MPERGALFAIGGHEDRTGDRRILKLIAERLDGRPLALVTAASRHPAGYVAQYTRAFGELGVDIAPLADAGGVFLSGGKQARLVERLRASGSLDDVRRIWDEGGPIAGTSAGASALGPLMLVRGRLIPGLGFVPGVIIDQHFSERGRQARLRGAVALAPDHLGIGIDEDTAVEIVDDTFTVRGSGTVTLSDRAEVLADGESFTRSVASSQRR